MKRNNFFTAYFPISTFIFFLIIIIGATLYYSPGWGLVDDRQCLENAKAIWGSGSFLNSLWVTIKNDFAAVGVFRPGFFIWTTFTYYIFKDSPVILYILIAIFNMLTILIWGVVFHKLFSQNEEKKWINIFFFPLSFFIFTPFWNIFMIISLQEKFVFFFSAISLYFFIKGYEKNKYYPILIAGLLVSAGVLIKPTCIYLSAVFYLFAFLDIIFLNYRRSLSYFVFIFNFFIFVSCFFYSVTHLRGYTLRYDLRLAAMVKNILTVSVMLKSLAFCAIFLLGYIFIRALLKKNRFSPLCILIPLGFLCYLAIFSPWGFPNYLLSAATPYIFGMFFPLYAWAGKKSEVFGYLSNSLIIFIVAVTFIFILIPRISGMSDIKNAKNFIKEFNVNNGNSVYFFPPPYYEATAALRYFTNADVMYCPDGILSKNMLKDCKCNYLIFKDEHAPVTINLNDVKIDKEIYHNNTWKIIRVVREDGNSGQFTAVFQRNLFLRINNFLRDL